MGVIIYIYDLTSSVSYRIKTVINISMLIQANSVEFLLLIDFVKHFAL